MFAALQVIPNQAVGEQGSEVLVQLEARAAGLPRAKKTPNKAFPDPGGEGGDGGGKGDGGGG